MTLFPILLFEKNQGVSIGGVQLLSKQYGFVQKIVKPLIYASDYQQILSEIPSSGFFFEESEKYKAFTFRANPLFSKKTNPKKIGKLERNILFGFEPEESLLLTSKVIDSLYNELRIKVYSEFALKEYESQQLGLVIKPELKINPNSVDVGTILNIGFKYDLVLIPDRIFNQLGTDIKVQRQSLIGIGL